MTGILAGLLLVPSQTVFAESAVIEGETEPAIEETYTAVDGNRISDERLRDRSIEYEELGSLIHANNLSIQEMVKDTEDNRKTYTEIREYLKSEKASAKMNKEKAEDEGDMDSYAEYASIEAVYQSAVKSYNQSLKKLNKYSSNKTRLSQEKQLTASAQSLMISWHSLEQQKEYLDTMTDLYRQLYEDTKLKQTADMAAEQEVSEAYNSWMEMELSRNMIEDNEAAICQNLFLILGLDQSENMELQEISPVDVTRMDSLNLETDTSRAISNNADVISVRSDSSDGSSSGVANKMRNLEELEEKVKIKMEQLYARIQQAKISYEAARDGYAGAKQKWDTANQKQSLGMLSNAEYLQEKIAYVQKKNDYQAADLAFFQALENYDWAVKGIVALD